MTFIQILFGIIVFVILLYGIYYAIYVRSGNEYLISSLQSLQEKKDILYPDQTMNKLLASPGSTIMGFFKLENGDRTVKYSNSYISLLQVENNWFLEISPAPIGKEHVSARLRVQTNGHTDGSSTIQEEVINLPDIPKQRWVCIAILRDGRRFDVIYDNQIVASQRLENYPVVISSALSVGNQGLSGSVIHVLVNGRRLTPSEVEKERLQKVDTNNTVIESNALDMSFPMIRFFTACPPGLPCDTITKPPNDKLLQWNTPYA
jgi:hypothetical protein